MKSFSFVVVIDEPAKCPRPAEVVALPSKGEVVSTPLIPKATAAAEWLLESVIVIAVEVLSEGTAYQVSALTWPYWVAALKFQVKSGELMELTE